MPTKKARVSGMQKPLKKAAKKVKKVAKAMKKKAY